MQKLLLGIDIGTSGVKSVVSDTAGHVIVQSTSSHDLSSLHPGWAEESPLDWWSGTIETVRACLASANVSPDRILAVGVSGMVPAIVLLDKDGQPVRASIQQNDARAFVEIDELKEQAGLDRFFEITGSVPSQQSVGPKLIWLQRHEPENWRRVTKVTGSYDYINYCLTGELSIESNWALESGFYDLNCKEWSDELLILAGVTREILSSGAVCQRSDWHGQWLGCRFDRFESRHTGCGRFCRPCGCRFSCRDHEQW